MLKGLIACAIVGAGVFWALTRPAPLETFDATIAPDLAAGAQVFAAAGCASCHHAPGTEGEAKLVLSGGNAFDSPFGTFYAPNISSDAIHGIGGWSLAEFSRAVTKGVSPEGQHYYPAFPYTSYRVMTQTDVANLFGYMQALPASDVPSKAHDVGFPFNIRRGLGLWKRLYLTDDFVLAGDLPPDLARGRYLVEGLGHCAECHTPRDGLGGLDRTAWLTGAPNPSGKGRIPGVTPAQLEWSESDLIYYFESGFTPDYDSVGGSMAAVVSNLARLPASDREAVAAYLKALP